MNRKPRYREQRHVRSSYYVACGHTVTTLTYKKERAGNHTYKGKCHACANKPKIFRPGVDGPVSA